MEVRGRGAVMDLAHEVNGTRVEEDALGQRRLARVDVRGHAEVAGAFHAGKHWRTTAVLRLAGADVLKGRVEDGCVRVHGLFAFCFWLVLKRLDTDERVRCQQKSPG